MKNTNNVNKNFKINSNTNKPEQKYQTSNLVNQGSAASFTSEPTQKDTALSPSGIDSQNYQSVDTHPEENTYNDDKTTQNKVNSSYPSNVQNKSQDNKGKSSQNLQNNVSKTSYADGADLNQTKSTYQQFDTNKDYKNSSEKPNNVYSAKQPSNPGQQNPGNIQDPYKKPAINDPQAPNTPNQYEKAQKPGVGKTWQNTSTQGLDNCDKLDYEENVQVETQVGSSEVTDNSVNKYYSQAADTKINPKQKGIDQNYDQQKSSPLETYEASEKNRNQQGPGQNSSSKLNK